MSPRLVAVVAAAAVVIAFVAVLVIAGGSEETYEAADVERLFADDVSCASVADDGTRWECTSPDGHATLTIGSDGEYSSRAVGIAAPAGCCLRPGD